MFDNTSKIKYSKHYRNILIKSKKQQIFGVLSAGGEWCKCNSRLGLGDGCQDFKWTCQMFPGWGGIQRKDGNDG